MLKSLLINKHIPKGKNYQGNFQNSLLKKTWEIPIWGNRWLLTQGPQVLKYTQRIKDFVTKCQSLSKNKCYNNSYFWTK